MSRAPLLVGTIAILAVVAALCYGDPSPGPLSRAHATTGGSLPTCAICHAEQGLDAGCLACHTEIESQLNGDEGYHHALIGDAVPRCARCHPEHHGASFDVMEAVAWEGEAPEAFTHPHVAFQLAGAHDDLECQACHKDRLAVPGHSPSGRRKTFLGLQQGCVACHENVHGGRAFDDCTQCHGQETFETAGEFDHDEFFPLTGGHTSVQCNQCHLEGDKLSFGTVKGTTCAQCHEDPHETKWQLACDDCHVPDAPTWASAAESLTPALHGQAGFSLAAPHDRQSCEACHTGGPSFAERFQSPARSQDRCDACHQDVHAGQFEQRFSACRDCHAQSHFVPSQFGQAEHHRFALRGAHAEQACEVCHKEHEGVRRFVGTPSRCVDCHEDVHEGQFAQTCSTCHGEHAFRPSTFTAADHTSFALRGAHASASCENCHTLEPGSVRRFRGTARDCASCHDDPHGGQFKQTCAECHDETSFRPARFGQRDHGAFPLTGAHDAVACIACHKSDLATGIRQFSGTSHRCAACHEDPHGDQFAGVVAQQDCTACHEAGSSTFEIRPFDHAAKTGHALLGKHAAAKCTDCHREPGRGQPRQYRGTSQRCSSCHTDEHRGQFAQRDCRACHTSQQVWRIPRFDHATTRFPLDSQHARLSCSECHMPVSQRDGTRVVQYRPLGTNCKDCHGIRK